MPASFRIVLFALTSLALLQIVPADEAGMEKYPAPDRRRLRTGFIAVK